MDEEPDMTAKNAPTLAGKVGVKAVRKLKARNVSAGRASGFILV